MTSVSNLNRFLLVATLALAALHSHAACPKSANEFQVFAGDVNGDGNTDYAVAPRTISVPIPLDDDLTIIVPVKSSITGFTYVSQPGGSRVFQVLPETGLPAGSNWQPATLPTLVADVYGSGCNSLVIRGLVSTGNGGAGDTIVVRFTPSGPPSLAQLIRPPQGTHSLSDGDLIIGNPNADSRQDLVQVVGGLIQAVYASNSQGQFVLDDDVTILAVWADFIKAASTRDSRATLYLSQDVMERFKTSLTTDALQSMTQGLKQFGIASSGATGAMLTVQRTGPDGDALYSVSFGKDGDGAWRVSGF